MEESEKRGRTIVARRQQQYKTTSTTNISVQNKNPQHRPKRKINDFIMGVAAGLSARKNNLMSGGLGQATVSSSAVLPGHLDFSYRDRSDVTAKRRFQVKVPHRLMAVLTIVFLIFPGLIFLHKELHIHEYHSGSHFKTEKYVNVNTKEVWENFRLATTTDEIIQHKVGENATTSQRQTKIQQDHFGDVTSDLHNYTVAKSVVLKNKTYPPPTTMDNYNSSQGFLKGGISGDAKKAHDDGLSLEVKSTTFDEANYNELSSKEAAAISSSDTIFVESNGKKINHDNINYNETMGTLTNSSATSKRPNRRRS